jgi:hypothetical protein
MAESSECQNSAANDSIYIESILAQEVVVSILSLMRVIRIDHVSLDVRDRPASVTWY